MELEVSPQELTALNDVLRSTIEKWGWALPTAYWKNSGLQRLDKQALSYSRIRKLDSDFKEWAASRRFCAMEQMKESSFFQLARLATFCLGKVRTDGRWQTSTGCCPCWEARKKSDSARRASP